MANVTASMVKDLRDKTGAGMMDCKSALSETNGDMEAAVDWLRKKGLSKAAKKAGRVAAEGLVGVAARAVRYAVDQEAARPADALAAIVLECDRLLAAGRQVLVQDVEHLEERHVGRHAVDVVGDESSRRAPILLPPDSQAEFHL